MKKNIFVVLAMLLVVLSFNQYVEAGVYVTIDPVAYAVKSEAIDSLFTAESIQNFQLNLALKLSDAAEENGETLLTEPELHIAVDEKTGQISVATRLWLKNGMGNIRTIHCVSLTSLDAKLVAEKRETLAANQEVQHFYINESGCRVMIVPVDITENGKTLEIVSKPGFDGFFLSLKYEIIDGQDFSAYWKI